MTVVLSNDLGSLPAVTTAADGSFAVDGVPPGSYTARFGRGAYHQVIPRLRWRSPGTTGLVLEPGGVDPLDPLEACRGRRVAVVHDSAGIGHEAVAAGHLWYAERRDPNTGLINLHVLSVDGTPPLDLQNLADLPGTRPSRPTARPSSTWTRRPTGWGPRSSTSGPCPPRAARR